MNNTNGWGFPVNSRRAHYFIGGTSLCGKWAFFGAVDDGDGGGPDDCAMCSRKLLRDRPIKPKEAQS